MAADPELVKALIDAAAAAFQAHGDYAGVDEVAQRVATATGQSRIARPITGARCWALLTSSCICAARGAVEPV